MRKGYSDRKKKDGGYEGGKDGLMGD